MSSGHPQQQNLGIDLHFRPIGNPDTWRQILDAIVAWEPILRPFKWLEASDPGEVRRPWSEDAARDLFERCAAHTALARIIEADVREIGAITVRVRKAEVVFQIAIGRPAKSLDVYLFDLLRMLEPTALPALAMIFDLDGKHDAEVIFQGLRGLSQVPPYLFLDSAAVDAIGREKLKSLPCQVEDAPGGGLLVISRADPWARRIGDQLRQARAVEKSLGVSAEKPLVVA